MTAAPLPATLLHDRMPDWWRPLALDLSGEIVDRRRRGVETLRAGLSRRNVVDAVAYAHGDEAAGWRVIDLVRDAARSADAGYFSRVGDAEPPALVAAALADQLAVAPATDLSTLVALLILCGAYSRVAPAIADMPLAEYAQRQLEHRAATAAEAQAAPLQSAGELIRELLGGTEHEHGHNGDATPALDRVALAALAARIDEIAAAAGRENAELRQQVRRQAWVTDPWCETAATAWDQLDPDARPLLAAVELADRTHGITPATGTPALLRRVLAESSRTFGLDEERAVAAAGPLLGGRLLRAPHPLLFPVSAKLRFWREHVEPDEPDEPLDDWRPRDDWRPLPAWGDAADAGEDDDLEVALQCYREALALRALDDD